jgi:FkbM family methyltransferase
MIHSGLVYDVGAHKGEDTEFYLKKGFSVVAIEAVPELCDELRQKFCDYLKRGQLQVLKLALTNKSGFVDFYVDQKKSVWGTVNPDWVTRNKFIGDGRIRKITVETSSLSNVMKEYGVPRYCKIDIEGSDLDALKSLQGAPEVPEFISIESEMKIWQRLVEEFEALNSLGYRKYKIVDQGLIRLQSCPQPPLEGQFCNHVFETGQSGLFGNELPGRWLDLFEALEVYKGIFRGYALNGNNGLFGRRTNILHILGHIQAMAARIRGYRSSINPAHNLPPASWYDTHAAQ